MYQNSYGKSLQSYETEIEINDEEAFQNALALVSQQFNRLPPTNFQKNQ